ncbi:hypothetical protein, partial [Ideonella sp. A 288]|uniref:hypothetical protein n=1 Tax=Ideonella sp. A 288 TaxID=1962181 RepID=UPI001F22D98C
RAAPEPALLAATHSAPAGRRLPRGTMGGAPRGTPSSTATAGDAKPRTGRPQLAWQAPPTIGLAAQRAAQRRAS